MSAVVQPWNELWECSHGPWATWINGVHLVAAVIAAAMSDNMHQEKRMQVVAATIPSSMRPKDSLISASLTLEGMGCF